jgi:hypothetical protein
MKNESVKTARIALGLLIFSVLGIFAALNVHSHLRLKQLREEGVEILGTVTGKHCQNHGEVTYSFTVAGEKFGGRDTYPLRCTDVPIGEPIKITYAASDPRNSECVSVSSKQEAIAWNYFGLLLISGVAVMIIYRGTAPSVKRS